MKTLTCNEMGGPCDTALSGSTPDELVGNAMEHLKAEHPEMAADVEKMTPEQTETWNKDFHAKYEAKPETV
jgi:predicted small metal-binding protein